jgi:hypothetical protein
VLGEAALVAAGELAGVLRGLSDEVCVVVVTRPRCRDAAAA